MLREESVIHWKYGSNEARCSTPQTKKSSNRKH